MHKYIHTSKHKHIYLVNSSWQLIIVVVNYSTLVGWVALTYFMKEGGTLYSEACYYGLCYDWRPDWYFWVCIETWNIASLIGKKGGFFEELRVVDVFCLQVVGW